MPEGFIGELRMFGFQQPPRGWLPCEGQLLNISQNQALFSLISTYFGGNGSTTFALPDLRARVPIHTSPTYPLGKSGGEAAHTLLTRELPMHNHGVVGNTKLADAMPSPSVRLAANQPGNLYGPPNSLAAMNVQMVGLTGGGQPHENRQPYLAVSICICAFGVFPSRSLEEED